MRDTVRTINVRNRIYIIMAWLLSLAVIIYAAYFSYANEFEKISFSRMNNDVYEIDNRLFPEGTLENQQYTLSFPVYLKHQTVNYLRVITNDAISNDTSARFYIYDQEYTDDLEPAGYYESTLDKGSNDIKLEDSEIKAAKIVITGPDTIVLKAVEFRESIDHTLITDVMPFIFGAVAVYLVLTLLAFWLWRFIGSRKYEGITKTHIITDSGSLSLDLEPTGFSRGDTKIKKTLISLIILAISVYSLLYAIEGEAFYRGHFQHYILVQLLLTLTIVIFIAGGKRLSQNRTQIDKGLFIVWAAFICYTTLSDLLVDKTYRFSEIRLFVVLMILSYFCLRGEKEGLFLRSFEIAVQMFLLFLLVISYVKDPTFSFYWFDRYSGPLSNPSIYALYLGSIWAVLLGSLENHIRFKSSFLLLIITIIEMGLTLLLLLATQSITPIIASMLVTALWAFRMIAMKKGLKFALVLFSVTGLLCVVGIATILLLIRNGVLTGDSRFIHKFQTSNITSILSGRDYYWRTYLREMNMFGHGKRPYLWGKRRLPHNAIIGMAYMYGVPVVVPYIIGMIMTAEKAYKFAGRPIKYSAVPLYSTFVFIIMSLADNVEQPYVWLPWIACYLMMVPVMMRPVNS